MSNFPAKNVKFDDAPDVIIPGHEMSASEFKLAPKYMYGFRHEFIMSLIRCGVLPKQCGDFTINAPVEGVMTITATYYIDASAFEKAVRETYTSAEGKKLLAENRAYAKEVSARLKKAAKERGLPFAIPKKTTRKKAP